jgi:hypothetical protein
MRRFFWIIVDDTFMWLDVKRLSCKITTRIAHCKDVIHPTLVCSLPNGTNSRNVGLFFYTLGRYPPFKIKILQANLLGVESKFLRLLAACMTHNHVEQYFASRVLADHTVSFARESALTMIAK